MHENHAFLEIVDEYSGEVIESCDEVGLLVLTNLHRRLMPLIRYPVGDRACWREPHGTAQRKFALKGRSASSQRVRVGILSLVPQEIAELIRRDAASDDWQMVIEQATFKDVLTLKWVPTAQSPTARTSISNWKTQCLSFTVDHAITDGSSAGMHVQCCTHEDLPRHPRSGKCLRVLDLRRYEHKDQEGPDGTADSA